MCLHPRLGKIAVSLWWTFFLLWLLQSSSEVSATLNRLASTIPSGTVKEVQSQESTSGSDRKGSSSLASSQITEPSFTRHLEQSSASADDEDGAPCGLTRSQRRQFYSTSTGTWNISDSVLEELNNDIQSVVSCAAPGDVILLPTTRRIQPPRSIIISSNITMTSQHKGPMFRNGSIADTAIKARLTCPPGDLLVIRSGSILIANVIFEDCTGNGNVVVIARRCDENLTRDTIHFRHVEFTNNGLSGGHRLLDVSQPYCGHLLMENIIIRNNRCGSEGCLALSMNNTLSDIHVVGTRPKNNDAIVMPSAFVFPLNSDTHATNVSALRSSIRLFNVINSTFTLSTCHFDGNTVNPTFVDATTVIGGSVLLCTNSAISIRDSIFENNSGWNGGVVYAFASVLILRNCSFRKNDADVGNGGAVYAINGSSMVIFECTFSKNKASRGAGVFSNHSSFFDVLSSSFLDNNGTSGAGLFVESGNISVELCDFHQNIANQSGSGLMAVNVNSSILDSDFRSNRGRWGGACAFYTRSNVRMIGVRFVRNYAGETGGAIYARNSQVIMHSTLLHNNTAVDFRNRNTFVTGDLHGCASAIYLRDGVLSLIDVNVTKHEARWYGTVYIFNSSATLDRVLVLGNVVSSTGGGLYFEISNIAIRFSSFESNSGSRGGAIYAGGGGQLQVLDTLIHNNSATFGGGGIYVARTLFVLRRSNITNNIGYSGGGCYFYHRFLSILDHVLFSQNRARRESGGGIFLRGRIFPREDVDLRYGIMRGESLVFHGNQANDEGGGVYAENMRNISLSNIDFYNNSGLKGAAISIHNMELNLSRSCIFTRNNANTSGGSLYQQQSNSSISSCQFDNNTAQNGGSLWIGDLSNSSIVNCTFNNNTANSDGGGIQIYNNTRLSITHTSFTSCSALLGGGIYATMNSLLNATSISLRYNVAVEGGGGIGIGVGSSIRCYRCEIENNEAKLGGGLYVRANDSFLIVAQLQESIFTNNTAFEYGGGLYFMRPENVSINCSTPNMTCSRVALLNTKFVDNCATLSASAFLTSDPNGVLVSCERIEPSYDFIDEDQLSSLDVARPNKQCTSWRGNCLPPNAVGDVITTYGSVLSFSIDAHEEAQIVGDVDSGFIVQNVVSGKPLPVIYVKVLDGYNNGPFPTRPYQLDAAITSPDGFFQGTIPANIVGGIGNLSDIVGFRPPRNYTLRISPNSIAVHEAEILIHVRECRIGEEPTTNDELCQECGVASYNFQPKKVGGCTPCPNDATCETRFVIPRDGYWHESPCQPKVKECLTKEACTYGERQEKLKNYSINFLDCDFNETVLTNYSKLLCREGYEGPLCGSCNKSYGLTMGFKCSKCPHAFESVFTLVFFTLYFLAIASFTIRGALPVDPKTFKVSVLSTSASRSEPNQEQQRDIGVNVEMVRMLVEGRVPSAYFRLRHTPNTSIAPSVAIQSKDIEFTRWISAEIFKVMINFLQVTAVVASIGVEWPEGVLTMFEATEYIGALTTSALSRPFDCIVSSTSDVARSVSRTMFSICVPGVVMGIFVSIWGLITLREKKGMLFFLKRTTLSVIAVTYISYLELTRLGVRVFYCVDAYDSNDYSSSSQTSHWAIDTSIRCYEKEHIGFIIISIFVLVLVSLLFPLISSIYLFRNKIQPEQTSTWTHETMGFLYRAFKERFVFWESVVMFRKACLSITVVFSYPLGGQSQGLIALGVLLFCLYLQMACSPYKEEFHKLNYYESGSLLVSCFTFILSQFFSVEHCPESAKRFLEVTIITINTTFFTFLLIVFFKSGMTYIRTVLKYEDFLVDDSTSWWRLLKLFVTFQVSQMKLFREQRVA